MNQAIHIDSNQAPAIHKGDAQVRVGITIGLHNAAETLWNNGIKQNAVFLAEALKHCANVASVELVNTTSVPITAALPWDQARWPTRGISEALDELDVVIELGGQITADQTEHIKSRGGRLVSYCCGSEYVHFTEGVLFGRQMSGANLFINQRYDGIWMVPQVAHISQPYFEVLRRQRAHVIPFVWSPVFLEQCGKDLPDAGRWRPPVDLAPWRLTVMEPNIDVVKFCLYPILIAESAYRARPDSVGLLQITNAETLATQNMDFIALMNQLDIVRQHKAVFLGRHDTPEFLSNHTDLVISHQWANPLNYFYLECAWQGYPLVHNAYLCRDLGYFYNANDTQQGCAQVLHAMDSHSENYTAYRERQRKLITRYLPGQAQVTATYTHLLDALFQSPAR